MTPGPSRQKTAALPTVLLATEANEGLGHIAPWLDFVNRASQQKLCVHMAAPDAGQLIQLIGSSSVGGIWQAPVLHNTSFAGEAAPMSWSELLLSRGYGNVAQLKGAINAWVSVLKSLRPQIVLADYAPALLAAARITGIPSLEVGGGFCVPPFSPSVRHFPGVSAGDHNEMNRASNSLIDAFNAAFQSFGHQEVMNGMGDMALWPARRVVLSWPELDHYGPRPDIFYAGFLGALGKRSAHASSPDLPSFWPARREADQKQPLRVLGYLKAATPGLQTLIAQLRAADVPAYLVVPDSTSMEFEKQGSVSVVSRLIDLPQAMQQADVYLSNGGLHGVGLALTAGCWPVVVPMQAEQVAMARNLLARQWGGLWLPGVAGCSALPWPSCLTSAAKSVSFARHPTGAENMLFQVIEKLTRAKAVAPTEPLADNLSLSK